MHSASDRYVISFNGEIYNYKALRSQLEQSVPGIRWRGHSDTEIMLAAISHWGFPEALAHFNGMFSFALWDKQERALHLTRDRLGEKPLYYGWMGNVLLFGSELKALRAHPSWHGRIDRSALSLFMRHNYVPAPLSIYEGIRKLAPGAVVTFRGDQPERWPAPQTYWSFRQVAECGSAHPLDSAGAEAEEQLHQLLLDAVALRMEADVPLGAFLSGGVDSSAVVALMQAQSSRPINTFSIGFSEAQYDEAHFARAVASHLKTNHTELYITPRKAMDVIPRLPTLYDEPFADVSQIPTFLVSELARQSVTVSLSGDGGDELFGGYDRYSRAAQIWGTMGWIPSSIRNALAASLETLTDLSLETRSQRLKRVRPLVTRGTLAVTGRKVAGVLRAPSRELLYRRLITNWNDADQQIVIGACEPQTALTDPRAWPRVASYMDYMMFQDTVGYLPDDILVKLDRASMGVSLEARVPMLDHRVVEFAWHLPVKMKLRRGLSKWLLRQVLYRYVPRRLIERPKMGFGVPIDTWLRGPLRDWAETLLAETRLRKEGLLEPEPIRRKWSEHLAGTHNWQYQLWGVLIFQAWLETVQRELG